MTDAEKHLIRMQEQFAREQDPAKKARIRRDYIAAHRRWVAQKSQLRLSDAAI